MLFAVAAVRAQGSFDVVPLFSPQGGLGQEFGRAACVADVDHDGFADVVALESLASVPGVQGAGKGWVFYGPTLDQVSTFQARDPAPFEMLGGGGCCTGDVNGDGWIDLLVGSRDYVDAGIQDAGRAHVFLGPDFQKDFPLLDPYPAHDAHMGDHGLLLYDVDGDGLDDVFVSSIHHDERLPDGTQAEDAGRVYFWPATAVLTGSRTTPVIIENPAPLTNPAFAIAILPAIDTDPPTLLFSANDVVHRFDMQFDLVASVGKPAALPPVSTVSGFGQSVATGKLGLNDEFGLLVTAYNSPYVRPCTGSGKGAAFVLTGAALDNVAVTLVSPDACTRDKQYFGLASLASDVDRDGQEDLLVSDASLYLDLVRLYWGPDYSRYETLGNDLGPLLTDGFGRGLAAGDIDGDGFDELVVYAAMGADSGALYIHDWRTLHVDVDSLSIGAGGDAHFTLDLSTAQAGKTYVASLGVSGSDPGVIAGPGSYVPLNVDAVTMAGLALLNSPILEGFTGILDGEGRAEFALHLPGGFAASMAGAMLTVAAVIVDADGRLGAGSSAVTLQLAP